MTRMRACAATGAIAAMLLVAVGYGYREMRAGSRADDPAGRSGPLVAETPGRPAQLHHRDRRRSAERAQGLMFRRDMADDHGMLFVFEETQQVGFWMKDTPMPLDLIFIGAGRHA